MDRNSNWGTFYGRTIKVSDLSHQHLSNILRYFELVLEMGNRVSDIDIELIIRFGGIRLPYHPQIAFTEEINTLKRKGYTTGEIDADIVVNGRWVGKIKYY